MRHEPGSSMITPDFGADYPADALALAVRAAGPPLRQLTDAYRWQRLELEIEWTHYGPMHGRSVGAVWLAVESTVTFSATLDAGKPSD